MSSSSQLAVIPNDIAIPAHLQTPDIIAAIAAANAAAAGGVRAGGFPTISIKANKFHIKDQGETVTLMSPSPQPGQPPLPMMCLEVVIVDANAALSHTFFAGEYKEGENKEPDCRSSNGITPDAEVANKQSPLCATCPQYAWGSATSKLSGKPIRACSDGKQLAVLPAGDLAYKMLGLQIGPGSLTNWGKYVQALSGRNFPIFGLVTNITFDQSANGVLQFSFNRFLSAEESAKVAERKAGDDAKLIVAQSRTIAAAPALPAPAATIALPPAAVEGYRERGEPGPATVAFPAGINETPTAPIAPAAQPVVATGFGAVPPAVTASVPAGQTMTLPAAPPPADPVKRTRAKRVVADADQAHIPVDIRATIKAVGADSAAGKALLALYPAPTPPADATPAVDPYAHVPADIMATVTAVGVDSEAGRALLALYPAPGAATAIVAAPVVSQPAPPAPVTPLAAAAPVVTGFGSVAPPATPATPQVVAAGASLADKLRAKLGLGAAA